MSDELEKLRVEIAEVDRQILQRIAERQALAVRVAQAKEKVGLPVKNHAVEARLLERTRAQAKQLGIDENAAVAVLETLIDSSCRIQDKYLTKTTSRPRKIFIVGAAGGMGHWLARFFSGRGHEVTGCDLAPLPEGVKAVSFGTGVLESDFIVLATPISATPEMLDRVATLSPKGVVFDIGSVKASLLPAIASAVARGVRVASAHPMLGPTLPTDSHAPLLVCETGDAEAAAAVESLFAGTNLGPRRVSAADHDTLMALVLGVPHLINLVFAGMLADRGFPVAVVESVAGTTYRIQASLSARVAKQCPDLYYEIQAENSTTLEAVSSLRKTLDHFEAAIRSKDRAGFRNLMEAGRGYFTTGEAR